jgi:AcrR family transcriptional regulator
MEHRARILSAARQLLEKYDMDAVSMHQVAREAQVGQGTLYRHFAHKGLICLALLQEDIIRFQHSLLAYFEQAGETVPVLEQLRFFLRQLATFNDEHAFLLSGAHACADGESRSHSWTTPLAIWLREVAMVLLNSAVERQELALLDSEYAAYAILAPLSSDQYHYQRSVLGYERERILSSLEYILFHGLR